MFSNFSGLAFPIALVATLLCLQTDAAPFIGPTPHLRLKQFPETDLETADRASITHTAKPFQAVFRQLQQPEIRALAKSLQSAAHQSNATEHTTVPEGYTFDPCRYHEHCIEPRLCVTGDLSGPCNGIEGCFCLREEISICKTCSECSEYPSETCAVSKDSDSELDEGICLSSYTIWARLTIEFGCNSFPELPTGEPTSEPEEYEESGDTGEESENSGKGDVPLVQGQDDKPGDIKSEDTKEKEKESSGQCIDANLLQHLAIPQRVYKEHVRALVLCDPEGSCATPGHMVVYKGDVTMMSDYCARRRKSCVSRTLLVNSPRFRKALRVPSRTDGLEFTALAARFESRVEAQALSFAIRLGL